MNDVAPTPDRELLDSLGDAMKNHQRVEVPVRHIQTPGLYAREVRIAKGTKILSARHLTEHPYVISHGKILVVTEDGEREILEAPHTGITKPGTRRALHALEDTVWTTFHPTDETDIEAICFSLVETESDTALMQWAESLPKIESCPS